MKTAVNRKVYVSEEKRRKADLKRILLNLKVNRGLLKREKIENFRKGTKAYDAFSDAICDLYAIIDRLSVEQLEQLVR